MKIIVTGAAGQVGHELSVLSWAEGIDARALRRAELDIADAGAVAAVLTAGDVDLVVNAAAYTAVDRAEEDQDGARAANARGPANLARRCAQLDIPLVHISTDYVFDGRKGAAYLEDDPVAPLGVYGATKAEGEAAVREATPRHVIIRTAGVFGSDGGNFVKTMLRLGAERDRLTIVDDQHCCPTGSRDIALAIGRVAERIKSGADDRLWGTFHFCGVPATTWCGFASEIFAVSGALGGPTPRIEPIATSQYPTPATRPAYSVLDCTKIGRVFDIAPPSWRARLQTVVKELLGRRTD